MADIQCETTETHWDCECTDHYIIPKSVGQCNRCGARAEDQPDSRVQEINLMADISTERHSGTFKRTHNQRCRCCAHMIWDYEAPICTRCIPKHWGKHAKGINASRCHEFKQGG